MSTRLFSIASLSSLLLATSVFAAQPSQKTNIDAQVFVVRDSSILKDVQRSLSGIDGAQKVTDLKSTGAAKPTTAAFILPADADATKAVRDALSHFKPVPVASLSNIGARKSAPLAGFVGRSIPYTSRVTSEAQKDGSERITSETAFANEGLDLVIEPAFSKGEPGFNVSHSVTKLVGGGVKAHKIGSAEIGLKRADHFAVEQGFSVPEEGRNVVFVTKGLEDGDYYVTVIAAKQSI